MPHTFLLLFFCALSGVSIIARQLIRESLFQRALAIRGFPVGSTWYTLTHKTSLSRDLVWGAASQEMLKKKQLRNLIIAARTTLIVLYFGLSGLALTLLWSALMHHK